MARFEIEGVSLELDAPPSVYLPSDDTRLLAKAALEQIGAQARGAGKKGAVGRPLKVLEIGCGSGAVSLSLAKAIGKECQITACDISPDAVKAAQVNAKKNKLSVKILESNLFSALSASSKFDWILFNPPYLPTSKLDQVAGPLNDALDGGADGLKMVLPFLAGLQAHLTVDGRVLMVVSSLQPKKKLEALVGRAGLRHRILLEESFFFEKLQVWLLHKAE